MAIVLLLLAGILLIALLSFLTGWFRRRRGPVGRRHPGSADAGYGGSNLPYLPVDVGDSGNHHRHHDSGSTHHSGHHDSGSSWSDGGSSWGDGGGSFGGDSGGGN
ncbi:hypothetical protein Acy02nite_67890 [Actinoplanes cyaneus]|uniref:Uncharacterized protein n=1 Tax=Actinoplanes cyaneus TaxID=52696 RepID=A0A919ISR1_9ACTN|nr:hypothetical protein [Actinoplanes cyaneus]MCW2139155.1 hypothetical protein [Actinoplanes cyaneus]GID68908.1 hypothetical protein Acy02nite_67890 [Actinoplanes cyaneus]